MTIASELGFVVGKEYEVVSLTEGMGEIGVKVGDYVLFTRDDRSPYPVFEFNGEEFYANIDPSLSSPPVRIIPKERPTLPHVHLHSKWMEMLATIKEKELFTKADLKDGMLVGFRNGRRAHYSKSSYSSDAFIQHNDYPVFVHKYSDTLESLDNVDYDIMKVYALGELIWERKEKTEKELQMEKLEATIKQAQEELTKLKEMK